MSKILFVSKDIGGSHVMKNEILIARQRNDFDKVYVVAEGKAMERFQELNIPLYKKGTVNFQTEPFTLDVEAVLDDVKPDIVVVTIGYPINLERKFADAVTARKRNGQKIKLVLNEDFWCNTERLLHTDPDLIITVDEYGISKCEEMFPGVSAYACGNPGAVTVDIPQEVQETFDELRKKYGHTIVFAAGGSVATLPEIELMARCLQKTKGDWCLIPRFHPKYVDIKSEVDERTWGEVWRERLLQFGERVQYVDTKNTEAVILSADIVLSGYSTLIATAVYGGKRAVCLETQETLKAYCKEGIYKNEIPQVALGIARGTKEPIDILSVSAPTDEAMEQLKPHDPEKTYELITQLV